MILILDKFIGIDPKTQYLPKLIAKWGKHWETLFLAPEQTKGLKMEKMRVRKQTLWCRMPRIPADP